MPIRSNHKKTTFHLTAILLLLRLTAFSQDDALSLDDIPEQAVLVKDAFNGPFIIYSQSTSTLEANRLDVVIGHRFGKINEGAFNAFGLDQGFIRIGFEYGIKDWLTAGIGRSSLGKSFDAYLKHRPLIQTESSAKKIPVSLALLFNAAFSSNELRRQNDFHTNNQFINQLIYTTQASVSRQFSERFSAQLTGSWVHRNSVTAKEYNNDVYGAGAAIRLQLTERMHFVSEYIHMFDNPKGVFAPVAFGIDLVAGGHVFNMHFANSASIIEKDLLTATTDSMWHGGARFGFTVRRSFMLKPAVEGGKIKY